MDTQSSVQIPQGCCHAFEVLGRSIDQSVEVLRSPLNAVGLGGDSTDYDILHVVAFQRLHDGRNVWTW
jgi:hypothetical protein